MPDTVVATRSRLTPEGHVRRQASDRRSRALDGLVEAIEESAELKVPPPVTEVKRLHHGAPPKMSAEAFELARQVYYLQHGTRADAARAVIAAGLSDTDDYVQVYERLKSWWAREEWPLRRINATFAIRDANNDGGVYRSSRICKGVASGKGPTPAGTPCTGSALADSDYCFGHDPRPEYVEKRKRQIETFVARRNADMVPLGPFQQWCEEKRLQLLADAKADPTRRVDPKQTGWGLLAAAMGVDLSMLSRYANPATSKSHPSWKHEIKGIRARTVAKYLAPLGATFEDVYGYPAPQLGHNAELICPDCGGPKNHESKVCRECYDQQAYGGRCAYVPSTGRRCPTRTTHESGYCKKCRDTIFSTPKPRSEYNYRKGFFRGDEIAQLYAVDEYLRTRSHRLVAKRMWATNVRGVQDAYSTLKTLEGALVKFFREQGLTIAGRGSGGPAPSNDEQLLATHAALVEKHGAPEWPRSPIDTEGLLPVAPFREWLTAILEPMPRGRYKLVGERIGMHPYNVSNLVKGRRGQWVRADVVARAAAAFGTTPEAIYR